MKKIKNNKILRIIFSSLIIISMFFVPSLIYSLVDLIGIKSKNICEIISLLIYLGILILLFRKSLKKEAVIFKNNFKKCADTGFKYWMLGLIIMFVSNLIINVVIFKGNIAANEELNREVMLKYPIFTMINAALVAPFIEELLFRKNLKGLFKNDLTFWIISGLLFGFCHTIVDLSSALNLLYIIPYGGLGFMFAKMYSETNTTFTNILMHMIHNFITCSLVLLVLG